MTTDRGPNLLGETPEESVENGKKNLTLNGYAIDEVKSALQKAIRRGDAEMAMFWAREMGESGLSWSLWSRLKVIAAEDCAGMEPLIFAQSGWMAAARSQDGNFIAVKVALELARCPKAREPDDYLSVLADRIAEGSFEFPKIPDVALDEHTRRGRRMGRGRGHFWHEGAKLENESPAYDRRWANEMRGRHSAGH